MFDLTAEEQREVEYFVKVAKDEGIAVRNEYAELFEKSMMAFALVSYAKDQVSLAEICDATQKKDLLHKALAAVAKAGTFHELPIYDFDLACVFEFLGERELAAKCFREFLSRREKFKPTIVDSLSAKQRDVPLAVKLAERKLGVTACPKSD
jgi:ribosomal protein S18